MFGLETLGDWFIQWKNNRHQSAPAQEENIPEWVNSLLPDEQ